MSQLIILSLESVEACLGQKVVVSKNKTRLTYTPANGVNTIVFMADVSTWTEGKEVPFYIEMSDEDILDGTTEEEVFRTFYYFTEESDRDLCPIAGTKVTYKSSVVGTEEIYEKFRYKVTKEKEKYLYVSVDTTAAGGFQNKVYFYLGDDGLSTKTIIIIVIVLVVILVIAGIVALVLFIRKKKKQKQKTQNQQAYNQQQVYNQQQMYNQNQAYNQQQMYNQNQMYNQQQGQTQVLYNEYGQQYVNNVQVNNQGIAPTDNQGNAQYGQYGQTAPYSSQGYVSGQ